MGEDIKVISFEKYQAKKKLEREVRLNIKQYEEKPEDELVRMHDHAKRLQMIWEKAYHIGQIGFIVLLGTLLVLIALGFTQLQLVIPMLILSIGFLSCAFVSIPNKRKHRLAAAHAQLELTARRGIV
ncbi:hypothetical protein [Paenibacillus sp. GXUN7292]|uniref:hypothetical protein n=1 Tax=Paenibacillus sp. GXUN7292 TaxID=3422499 RepID=UPI003D7E713D